LLTAPAANRASAWPPRRSSRRHRIGANGALPPTGISLRGHLTKYLRFFGAEQAPTAYDGTCAAKTAKPFGVRISPSQFAVLTRSLSKKLCRQTLLHPLRSVVGSAPCRRESPVEEGSTRIIVDKSGS